MYEKTNKANDSLVRKNGRQIFCQQIFLGVDKNFLSVFCGYNRKEGIERMRGLGLLGETTAKRVRWEVFWPCEHKSNRPTHLFGKYFQYEYTVMNRCCSSFGWDRWENKKGIKEDKIIDLTSFIGRGKKISIGITASDGLKSHPRFYRIAPYGGETSSW